MLEGDNLKTLILVTIFFSGSFMFSMNSTENRQSLVEASLCNIDIKLKELHDSGKSGDIINMMAYEMYTDLIRQKIPRHISNDVVRLKLIAYGLCKIEGSMIVLMEYPISDELPRLKRSVQLPRKNNDGKESN